MAAAVEAPSRIAHGLLIGEPFATPIPRNSHPAVLVTVVDRTVAGFTPKQLGDLVWAMRYHALYTYNRSPWVERDYSAPVQNVILLGAKDPIPLNSWHVELLDTSTEPGALGWHEDESHASKVGPSGLHSARGLAAGTETPLSKVFVKTSREDGVAPSEVCGHEINEMLVDPWVMNEAEIRVYVNPVTGLEYIGEVGDPVQGRGYDVGAPEGRPCKVPEAVVADIAYPSWWAQPQTRPFTSSAAEFGLTVNLPAWTLAPGGYMSIRKPGGSWEQIFGSAKAKAEAAAKGYERPGEQG